MWFASNHCDRSLRSLLAATALLLASARVHALGERWDPTLPQRFSLQRAHIAQRESLVRLPENPEVVWRVRVAGGVPFAPSATEQGSVVLCLTTPVVAEYDARGRLAWSARLGASSAATSPIVLGDGTRLILTQASEALGFSPQGRLLRRFSLPLTSLETQPLVAATFDGGVLIAAGRRLLRLDASLGVVASVRAEQEIRALLPDPEHSWVVTNNGGVFELTASGALKRIASFSARVDAVARSGPDHVLAILEGRRLVDLDLANLTPTTRFAETDVELLPLLTRNSHGALRLLTNLDFLLALEADARESFRVALPAANTGPRTLVSELGFDAAGTTLVARSGVDLVAIHADGALVRAEGTACAEPLPPVGAAPGYAVFACRSGIVLGLGERRSAQAPGAATGKAK
ncbi:MAG: hypothetical protein ACOY0T_23735 [Myxococcota bacterium]